MRIAVAPESIDSKIPKRVFEKTLKYGYISGQGDQKEWKIRRVGNIVVPRGVWRGIVKRCTADFFIFVLEAGKPYAIAFKEETGIEPLLLEYHAEKYKNSGKIELPKLPKGSKIVIIDKFYSGVTLLELKEMLEKMNVEVTLIALFPKSRMNLKYIDYIVWWDQLLKTKDIINFLDDESWHFHLCNLVRRR